MNNPYNIKPMLGNMYKVVHANGGSLDGNSGKSPINVDLDYMWASNQKLGNNRKMNRKNMEQLDNFFIKKGVPLSQRQALLYTILQESGADSLGAHGNGYYGLVGWSKSRYNAIKDKSLMGQAEHLYNTLYNGDGKADWNYGGDASGYASWTDARKAFIEAQDFDTAMWALTYGYVRPDDENKSYRIKYGPKHFATPENEEQTPVVSAEPAGDTTSNLVDSVYNTSQQSFISPMLSPVIVYPRNGRVSKYYTPRDIRKANRAERLGKTFIPSKDSWDAYYDAYNKSYFSPGNDNNKVYNPELYTGITDYESMGRPGKINRENAGEYTNYGRRMLKQVAKDYSDNSIYDTYDPNGFIWGDTPLFKGSNRYTINFPTNGVSFANGGPVDPPRYSKQQLDSISQKITAENMGVPFIKRALDPNGPRRINPDGSYSTHLLSYGDADGKYYVFPTIFPKDDGTWLEPKNPFKYALDNGEYIIAPDSLSADYYSRNGLIKHGDGGSMNVSLGLGYNNKSDMIKNNVYANGGSPDDPPRRYPISLAPSEFFNYYGFNGNNSGSYTAYEPKGAYGSYLGPYRLPEVVVTPKERELIEDVSFDEPAVTLPDYLGDGFSAFDLLPFARTAYNMGADLAENGLKNQAAYLRDYFDDPFGLPLDLASAVIPGGRGAVGPVTRGVIDLTTRTGDRTATRIIPKSTRMRNAGKRTFAGKVVQRKVREGAANNASQNAQETLDFAHRAIRRYAEEHPKWAKRMAKKGVDLDELYEASKHPRALDLIIPKNKRGAMISIAKRTAKREKKFADDFDKAYKRASKAFGSIQAIPYTVGINGALKGGYLGIGVPLIHRNKIKRIQKNIETSEDFDSGYTEKELELFNALEKNNRELANPDSTKQARDSIYMSSYKNYYKK